MSESEGSARADYVMNDAPQSIRSMLNAQIEEKLNHIEWYIVYAER